MRELLKNKRAFFADSDNNLCSNPHPQSLLRIVFKFNDQINQECSMGEHRKVCKPYGNLKKWRQIDIYYYFVLTAVLQPLTSLIFMFLFLLRKLLQQMGML